MALSVHNIANELDDEIETLQAIYCDDLTVKNSGSFTIRFHTSVFNWMVTFSTMKYPENKPKVSIQSTNSGSSLRSKDRDLLNQSIADHIAESEYEAEGYLFEFVEGVMERIQQFSHSVVTAKPTKVASSKQNTESKESSSECNQQSTTNQGSAMSDDDSKSDQGSNGKFTYEMVKGDLFTAPQSASLCHCVSRDLGMGKGIAVMFKRNFGGLGTLRKQQVPVGGVGVLSRQNRFVYYLITKKKSTDYPTSGALTASLKSMRDHAVANGVKHIAMPKIGSGLDRLKWNAIESSIIKVFRETNIKITVYEK